MKALFEDPQEELDPNLEGNNDDPAEMNMAFFLYIIKDILEYVGFFGDEQKNGAKIAARKLKMALAKFEFFTQKAEYLSKVQAILD